MVSVRKYYIYLIEDEVADYFYGRENKFYELFAADRYVLGELKKDSPKTDRLHYIAIAAFGTSQTFVPFCRAKGSLY